MLDEELQDAMARMYFDIIEDPSSKEEPSTSDEEDADRSVVR